MASDATPTQLRPNNPGRPRGSRNKTTRLLKDAVLAAAAAGEGGADGLVAYLKTQAATNPVAFLSLLGKILPLQVTQPATEVRMITASMTDEEAARAYAETLGMAMRAAEDIMDGEVAGSDDDL
jgi:hypothetical protein